ncbi:MULTISPECIES: hypothetical protein [Burkholderia]|uniref:hypothetical protein n=1 Tax=Burkholderia sp. JP2-270 TaxID=2217913 RepID=UPI0013A6C921|nr:hypothetical protein [Burkholderia sp. JP2-270]
MNRENLRRSANETRDRQGKKKSASQQTGNKNETAKHIAAGEPRQKRFSASPGVRLPLN